MPEEVHASVTSDPEIDLKMMPLVDLAMSGFILFAVIRQEKT